VGSFGGNAGDFLIDFPESAEGHIHVFLGLGARGNLTSRTFQNAGAILAKKLSNMTIHSVVLDLARIRGLDALNNIKPFIEGLAIGAYSFTKYFKTASRFPLGRMLVVIPDDLPVEDAAAAVEHASLNVQASNISRHLTNEACNYKTPERFEALIRDHLSSTNFSIRTLYDRDLREEKLNLIRAVGQAGSDNPRLLIIEDIRPEREFTLGVVGKAVTFDAGGFMLKSIETLPMMRDDVAGAAAVIGAISVIQRLSLDYNIVCAVPIAENLIDSQAYRPADVFPTRWGASVEVNNTDCEGRLLLADTFMYLQDTYSLNAMIDVATLTGAMARALGNKMAGYFTNNEILHDILIQTQSVSREKFWRLPLEYDYRPLLDSSFADIRNEGGDPKAITAALFLDAFIRDQLPWIHMDVGAIIFPSGDDPLYSDSSFVTGVPAITLIELFRILNRRLGEFPGDSDIVR